MKPTPEMVELARKLYDAGYRQEIRYGDWYLLCRILCGHIQDEEIFLCTEKKLHITKQEKQVWKSQAIPVLSLSTCLRWLEEKTGETPVDMPTLRCDKISVGNVWICWIDKGEYYVGDTPEEAVMTAMIKTLEATDAETK